MWVNGTDIETPAAYKKRMLTLAADPIASPLNITVTTAGTKDKEDTPASEEDNGFFARHFSTTSPKRAPGRPKGS